jgi:L-lactate dehydrogenase complex protein LldG
MNSRRAILDSLRSRNVAPCELPELDPERLVRYDDPLDQFRRIAEAVGARVHRVESPAAVTEVLGGLPHFAEARRIASLVPGILGTLDVSLFEDPHALSELDWTIAPGQFAVAENGAIWVDGASLPHRVAPFITQHLALVVPAGEIVPHMHAAYARLERPEEPQFGVFVAGPSKTADIEQSLVLGAHGCRTLEVFLCDRGE